ncbi:MAG: UbiA family prenyltransferase [Bacteroidales bacterium]
MNKIQVFFSQLIEKIENSKVPIGNYILTFIFIILIRCFFELISSASYFPLSTALHFIVFTISVCLSLIVLFTFFSKTPVIKVAKIVLIGFVILIFPPLFDLLFSLGNKTVMGYNLLNLEINPFLSFITFFGKYDKIGITLGIKIEICLVLFFSFLYFYYKTNFLKALLSVFVEYIVLFLFLSTPFLLKPFYSIFRLYIDYPFHDLDYDFVYVFSFLSLLFLCYIFYKTNKQYFFAIIKDIRLERTLHYIFVFILGIVIARKILFSPFVYNTISFWGFIFSIISIIFAWLFSVITNNIVDLKIDKISNPLRPSVQKIIPIKKYNQLAVLFLFLSIYTAAIVSWKFVFLVSIFIGGYYLYSIPPLRLKRVLLFSKFIIGFNSLIIFVYGYEYFTLFSTAIKEPGNNNIFLINFPISMYVVFLIGFSLCSNLIDIKDYEGDKHAKITTLPGVLGFRLSKIITGVFFLLFYLLLYFKIPKLEYYIPLCFIGLFQLFLFIRKKHNEKLIFLAYLFSLIIVIIYFYNDKVF